MASSRGNDGGREDGIPEETSVVANSGDNGDNDGNRNNSVCGSVCGDSNFNIGCNDQKGSLCSPKVNISKMNEINHNE